MGGETLVRRRIEEKDLRFGVPENSAQGFVKGKGGGRRRNGGDLKSTRVAEEKGN